MKTKRKICQSCGMPMNNVDILGTESNGMYNHDYCIFCYREGGFTNPHLTESGMKTVKRIELNKQHVSPAVIEKAVQEVPTLKRWRKHALN